MDCSDEIVGTGIRDCDPDFNFYRIDYPTCFYEYEQAKKEFLENQNPMNYVKEFGEYIRNGSLRKLN